MVTVLGRAEAAAWLCEVAVHTPGHGVLLQGGEHGANEPPTLGAMPRPHRLLCVAPKSDDAPSPYLRRSALCVRRRTKDSVGSPGRGLSTRRKRVILLCTAPMSSDTVGFTAAWKLKIGLVAPITVFMRSCSGMRRAPGVAQLRKYACHNLRLYAIQSGRFDPEFATTWPSTRSSCTYSKPLALKLWRCPSGGFIDCHLSSGVSTEPPTRPAFSQGF